MSFLHALSIKRHVSPGQFYAMPHMEQKFMLASITAELEADDEVRKKIEAMRNGG